MPRVRGLSSVDGLDVNATVGECGCPVTGSDRAVFHGREACTYFLLGAPRIDINKPDSTGQSPLLPAAANGHKTCILLAALGIDVTRVTKNGCTVLVAACIAVMAS